MTRFWAIFWLALKVLLILGIIAWVMRRALQRTHDEKLISKWIITGILFPLAVLAMLFFNPFLGVGMAALFGIAIGVLWAPNLGDFISKPFETMYSGGSDEIDPQPFYSIAEARRKQGRYNEAIEEVQKQLVRFPNDFQGWLLLAQIRAEDLKDLPAAQTAIARLLNQPGHAPKNLAHALNRLADWQLKFGRDIEAARESLERIIEKFPETDLAQLAAQRLAHLTDPESAIRPEEPRRIAIRHYEEKVGLRDDFTGLQAPSEDPADTAANYVRHLEEHPLDYEAREQLASIYADHYHRLDLAADQLEQLITYPNQPPKQVVHWLNLLADLYLRHDEDTANARRSLQRIVDLFPGAAAAENARQRMAYLNLELKGKQKAHAVKLGNYEQNIGLKKEWPT